VTLASPPSVDVPGARATALYTELADWWPIFSKPEDYAEEAAFYHRQMISAAQRPVVEVLELGSGGGNNASHLKQFFRMTLVDLSTDMLAVSRVLNPECEHIQGDMRALRLGREFDAVFIHDAIDYMTSLEDLGQAIRTAYLHCRPGGVAVFAPDHTRESYRPSTDHGGHDGEGRAIRYLEWDWDPILPIRLTWSISLTCCAISGGVRALMTGTFAACSAPGLA
jgi:SAM-dependent methyltransferase